MSNPMPSGTAPTPQIPDDVTPLGQTVKPEDAPAPEMSKEDRQKAVTEEYSKATTWLREQHRMEFNAHLKGALAARGVEWSPQPTKQEKAQAEIHRLAEEAGLTVEVKA